ncbi:MAG: hypothetical protein DRJ69_04310 [Thermoprotei archaeon]|nr:MAG: hypothetical protein DRJ69_04310 [Thermoprotei archaeon]
MLAMYYRGERRNRRAIERLLEIREWVSLYGKMTVDECVRSQDVCRKYARDLLKDAAAKWPRELVYVNGELWLREEYEEREKPTRLKEVKLTEI